MKLVHKHRTSQSTPPTAAAILRPAASVLVPPQNLLPCQAATAEARQQPGSAIRAEGLEPGRVLIIQDFAIHAWIS